MSSDSGIQMEGEVGGHRIGREELYIEIARLVARRSTCTRASVGCIAVSERRIIASGYVGSPPGQPHCLDFGCRLRDGHCVRTIHAESNLVAWSARTGQSIRGSTVYSTHSPCEKCAQLLVTAGIEEIVYEELYWDGQPAINLLRDVGVRHRAFKPTG